MTTIEIDTAIKPLLEVNNFNNVEDVKLVDTNLKEQQTTSDEKKNNLTDEEKFILMKEIEIKTTNKIKELYQKSELIPPLPIVLGAIDITPEVGKQQIKLLEQTIQVGVDEFKQKLGRNMTYSEMRMMFG